MRKGHRLGVHYINDTAGFNNIYIHTIYPSFRYFGYPFQGFTLPSYYGDFPPISQNSHLHRQLASSEGPSRGSGSR